MALSSANRCYDFPLAEPGQSKRRARFFLRGRTKTVRRRAGACAGRGKYGNAVLATTGGQERAGCPWSAERGAVDRQPTKKIPF